MSKAVNLTLHLSIPQSVLIKYCASYYRGTGEALPPEKLVAEIEAALLRLQAEIEEDLETAIEHNAGALKHFIAL